MPKIHAGRKVNEETAGKAEIIKYRIQLIHTV
jgi:hypothetical protein